jgi:hypothetical protein
MMQPYRPRQVLPLIAGAVLLTSGWSGPVAAQEDYRSIVTIMRACSQIADVPARVMCYDNNIRPQAGSAASAPQAPAAAMAPAPSAAPAAPAPSFGSEMLAPVRSPEQAAAEDAAQGTVAAIVPQEPGMYLITLADGAQWRFVDAAPSAWNPPRAGAQVEFERGSLGTVFMTYDGQRRLRVRRVR